MQGEEIYAQALLEIQQRRMQPALWAQAQSRAQGDGNAAISHYILSRISQGGDNGPATQILLSAHVHNPRHGVRQLPREAANASSAMPVFLRNADARAAQPAGQVPVWPGRTPETSSAWHSSGFGVPAHHTLCPALQSPTIDGVWRRCLVRSTDILLACGILLGLLVIAMPDRNVFPALLANLSGLAVPVMPTSPWLADVLVLFFLLPLALLLEAAIHALFGVTPGKALGGVELRCADAPLGGGVYLQRNHRIWLKGFALGAFPFSLVAPFWQFARIMRGLPTSYDQASLVCVRLRQISKRRMASLYALFVASMFACLAFGAFLFDVV